MNLMYAVSCGEAKSGPAQAVLNNGSGCTHLVLEHVLVTTRGLTSIESQHSNACTVMSIPPADALCW